VKYLKLETKLRKRLRLPKKKKRVLADPRRSILDQEPKIRDWLGHSVAVDMGLFDAGKVEKLIDEFFVHGRGNARSLAAALTIELFLRTFVTNHVDTGT
jgi:hypothetical protein